jgi:ferric-dicitrate binding protein FerR (iron transport regulator)
MSGEQDEGLKGRLEGPWPRAAARAEREWRRLALYLCAVTALLAGAVALAIWWH